MSTELHLWFHVWVPLAELLGKYLLLNGKAMFIFKTKLVSYLN